jgi:hypothetical protein
MTEAILSHPRLKMERKIALVKALSKIIWIQNDLFAKWYVRDGDEFQEQVLVPEIEPEGYLHGKRILHDGSESESEIDEALKEASCPFASLASSADGEIAGDVVEGMKADSLDGSHPAPPSSLPRPVD